MRRLGSIRDLFLRTVVQIWFLDGFWPDGTGRRCIRARAVDVRPSFAFRNTDRIADGVAAERAGVLARWRLILLLRYWWSRVEAMNTQRRVAQKWESS